MSRLAIPRVPIGRKAGPSTLPMAKIRRIAAGYDVQTGEETLELYWQQMVDPLAKMFGSGAAAGA